MPFAANNRRAKGEDGLRPPRLAAGWRSPSSGWPCSTDRAAGLMFPLVVTAALVLTVTYSLTKSIQYPELFRSDARYRTGLLLANGGIIAVCVALVAYSVAEADGRGGPTARPDEHRHQQDKQQ